MAKAEIVSEEPKKLTWLEEVKKDAERITLQRMKLAEEEKQYQQEKKAQKEA